MPPPRVLALDLGSKRVGVAVSDATATLASPAATIERSGDQDRDHARVAALVAEEGAGLVLVDERLTTVTADRVLLEQGLRAPERRRRVDRAAAAILLQAWLDGAEGVRWRADHPLGR